MKRKLILGIMLILLLVFAGCKNPANNNDDIDDGWPRTTGYTQIEARTSLEIAKEEIITVSPGQRFYASGSFYSMYGSSLFVAISSRYDANIIIDFYKLTFGQLRIYRNGTLVTNMSKWTTSLPNPISITDGDILHIEANPERQWSFSRNWMFGFSVVAP